jgi:DNA-damage-inducible protein J
MSTTMVHIRIDDKVKEKAAKTLAEMGISVSDAVRMLLVRVAAEKALPFEVKVPNSTTVKALKAASKRRGKRFKTPDALFNDLEIERMKNRIRGNQFRRDVKLAGRRGQALEKLRELILLLAGRRASAAAIQRSSTQWRMEEFSGLPQRARLDPDLQNRGNDVYLVCTGPIRIYSRRSSFLLPRDARRLAMTLPW